MKPLLTTILLASAALPALPGHAQGIGTFFGPTVGVARTVLDGQINRKAFYKTGLTGGLVVRIRPSTRFAVQPEILYSQQGAGNGLQPGSTSPDYELRLHYLSVPVLAKVYIGQLVNIQFGPQASLLLSGWEEGKVEKQSGGTMDVSREVSKDYSATSFSLCGGVGVDLPNGLLASVRLNYGFSDIDASDANARLRQSVGGLHNRGIEFSAGYLFGANKSKQ